MRFLGHSRYTGVVAWLTGLPLPLSGEMSRGNALGSRAPSVAMFSPFTAAKGERPWYVGKTEKHSFKGEVLTPHKLVLYNEALNLRKKGTPLLYLVARRTKSGRFAKPDR